MAIAPWFARQAGIGTVACQARAEASSRFGSGEYSTRTTLLLALLVDLLAHHFGLHPAIDACMAGLIMEEKYFIFDGYNSGENQHEKTRLTVDNVAYSWIGQVFFVQLGTEIVIDWQIVLDAVPETLAMTLGILVTQVASAGLTARYAANFDWRESLLIGFGIPVSARNCPAVQQNQ